MNIGQRAKYPPFVTHVDENCLDIDVAAWEVIVRRWLNAFSGFTIAHHINGEAPCG